MTSEDEHTQVYYPYWMKLLVYIGLPLMTLCALWVMTMPLYETTLTTGQKILMPAMGIAVLYQCYVGIGCYRHLNTTVNLHEEGIDVFHAGIRTEYKWGDLEVENLAFATTYLLKSKEGEDIGYFSHGIPNLILLVDAIEAGSEGI